MKFKLTGPVITLLVLGLFFMSACSSLQGPSLSPRVELPETYDIPGFGYSIDYPEGWTADTRDNYTVISEVEADNARTFAGSSSYEGFVIGFEHRPIDFLVSLGLERDATLEQLLSFNSSFFNWQASEPTEISLFGEPALSITGSVQPGAVIMGFRGDKVYLLTFTAPSDDDWEAFQLTYESMLASVKEADNFQQ